MSQIDELENRLDALTTAQMLSEADHTRSPEEILHSAWRYAGQLEKLFGPWYGQGPPTPDIPRY